MTQHLGGPETAEQIVKRHERFVRHMEQGTGAWIYKVMRGAEAVGSVVFWERVWRDEPVYEMGWSILPEYQGQGIGTEAVRLAVGRARKLHDRRCVHAFPSVDNAPSNAICRKAGFTLIGPCEFEYPKGHVMTVNDWRLDLTTPE
jgi:RimJ/RimL family protein N-acetyltransferase